MIKLKEVRLSRVDSLTIWPFEIVNMNMRDMPNMALCEMMVGKWFWPDIKPRDRNVSVHILMII